MRRPAFKRPRSKWRFILVIILLGVMMGGGFAYWQWRTKSVFATNKWRTNVLIVGEEFYLVSFPIGEDEKTNIVALPQNLQVLVPYGYGYYRLSALKRLSEIEQEPTLVRDTVEDMMGINIAVVINTNTSAVSAPVSLSTFSDLTSKSTINWSSPHSTSFADFIYLTWKLRTTPASEVVTQNLKDDRYLFPETQLQDGTTVYVSNASALDEFVESKFTETKIREQNISVEILNTTDTSGIGQQYARFLSHVGAKILRVDTRSGEVAACEIKAKSNVQQSILVQFIQKEFGCVTIDNGEQEVADVVVLIGKKYAERWQNIRTAPQSL